MSFIMWRNPTLAFCRKIDNIIFLTEVDGWTDMQHRIYTVPPITYSQARIVLYDLIAYARPQF